MILNVMGTIWYGRVKLRNNGAPVTVVRCGPSYTGERAAQEGGGVENPMGMAILAANLARNSDRAAAWT